MARARRAGLRGLMPALISQDRAVFLRAAGSTGRAAVVVAFIFRPDVVYPFWGMPSQDAEATLELMVDAPRVRQNLEAYGWPVPRETG